MPHVARLKVRFYELDPYGHVNHANYLNYFETARIELLDQVGFGLERMKAAGWQIVLVVMTVRFLSPATAGQELTIETEVVELGRVTTRWRQRIDRDGAPVATADIRAAFTDLEGRPQRLPPGLAEALAPHLVPPGREGAGRGAGRT